MSPNELRARHGEINAAVAFLLAQGWTLEAIELREAENEHPTARFSLYFNPPRAEECEDPSLDWDSE